MADLHQLAEQARRYHSCPLVAHVIIPRQWTVDAEKALRDADQTIRELLTENQRLRDQINDQEGSDE